MLLRHMDNQSEPSTTSVIQSNTDNSSRFLELEGLIRNYFSQVDNFKKELKKQKEMLEDSFINDAVYQEQDKKAKEVNKTKSSTKQEILKQPSLAELRETIDDLRNRIKEAEEVLSDYLLQFQKISGLNEIEVGEGETMIIVNRARLVKGSPKN